MLERVDMSTIVLAYQILRMSLGFMSLVLLSLLFGLEQVRSPYSIRVGLI
jgi:hypothetical protein